ncbi:MAG TPA: hypothetical protein ENK18_26975 [Deltaproteobacteria bacterium]|nr:hypothetical protein [Deltaproteobacteria bacterium]
MASEADLDTVCVEPPSPHEPPSEVPHPAAVNSSPGLHLACRRGDARAALYAIATGADVGRPGPDGWRPLHLAASGGHQALVALLLEGGARVDGRSRLPRSCVGATPLHVAAAVGSLKVAVLLLSAGADPDLRDEAGLTALHTAAARGDRALVKALLLAGADPAPTLSGITPLELALQGGHRATAALLRQCAR